MDRQILNFTANEQILVCDNPIKISANKVNYIEARFDLGQNWTGYDSVRAVWFNDFQCISTVLDSQGVTFVPFEVMKRKGNVKVNLVGSISENDVLTDRLTSYPVVAVVVDCIAQITGANTSPITPSEYEQFVASVRNDADRAEQGASDAEQSAQNASASATSASDSAESAHNDKVEIEQAIAEVIQQIEDFEQVQVVVNTLPPTSPATSDFTDGVLTLGIPQGVKGDTGNGIQSIEKISTSGLVDTYRITYTNGQTTTFTVTNGAKGDTGNGIASIEKTSTVGLVDTYTITYTDGNTSTFTVTNGEKGEQGEVSLDELLDNTIVQTNTDTEPYSFRATPQCGSLEYDEIVGASVGWNQQANISSSSKSTTKNGITATDNRDGSYTLSGTASAFTPIGLVNEKSWSPNHKYIFWGCPPNGSASTYQLCMRGAGGDTADDGKGALWNPGTTTWKGISAVIHEGTTLNNLVFRPNIVDLTLMLGSTIADYVYSLETATAGAGVAWLKSHFPKAFDNGYQPYSSGEIQNVHGLSAHVMKDSSDNIIGNYPLDSSLTLRGIYKMDADHNLYADGDVYKADGTVTRRYGVVDLGTLSYAAYNETNGTMRTSVSGMRPYRSVSDYPTLLCGIYNFGGYVSINDTNVVDGTIYVRSSTERTDVIIRDSRYTDPVAFKTAMSGVYLVYELATPTTETADPYTNPQQVESGGTEEYVSDSLIPIGHSTDYPMTLSDTMPTANGTYSMSVTVQNGKRTINWT